MFDGCSLLSYLLSKDPETDGNSFALSKFNQLAGIKNDDFSEIMNILKNKKYLGRSTYTGR